MEVHLVDGTYELFRHYFALPESSSTDGVEIAAARGVLSSVISMLEQGATHVGVATDQIIESFRNQLYGGYKTGEGIEPALFCQFPIVEEALDALGVVVWPMVEFEADDALAAAAAKFASDADVERVLICTPDKDLSQCVKGTTIVQLDRRRNLLRDEAGVVEKFGVKPASIPDYLAAVGDAADGYPGLKGWGAKAAASVLSRYEHFEEIPKDFKQWDATVRGAAKLASVLFDSWEEALLFRRLATLREDTPIPQKLEDLKWSGPKASFGDVCKRLKADDLLRRVTKLA